MDETSYPERFAAAVAEVVEQARWDARIGSIRELARLSGMTHTALNARANNQTPYTVRDLAALAPHLKLEPAEVLKRARLIAGPIPDASDPGTTLPRVAKRSQEKAGASEFDGE